MVDPKVEKHLKEAGVSFVYREEVPVKSIHRVPLRSTYQARVISAKLNSDTVDLYATSMRRGDDFPAPVLVYRTDKTYDILGGFHRVNAMHRAGRATTDAYVCDIGKVVADRVARTLNNLEAVQGSNKAERVAQARRLMELHGFSMVAAARDSGISEALLEVELRAIRAAKTLTSLGVDTAFLNTSHLAELARVPNDNVMALLATVASKARVGSMPLRPVIGEIRLARTELDQLNVVRSFEQTPLVQERLAIVATGTAHKATIRRRSAALLGAMTTIRNVLQKYPTPPLLGVTQEELDWIRKEWAGISGKMETLLESPAFARDNHQTATVPEAVSSGAS